MSWARTYPTTVTLAQLGELKSGDAYNLCGLANQLQPEFQFNWHPDPLIFEIDKYKFDNGALDLARAARDLLRRRRRPRPLVLLTSLPLASPRDALDPEGFRFIGQASFGTPDIAIVSTYLWERLPGSRPISTYLIFMLTGLALEFCSGLAYHDKKGCYFDYCQTAADIDLAFEKMSLCENCEKQIEAKVKGGLLRVEQVSSIKRLFNLAFGRKMCFVAMPFVKSLQHVYDLISDALRQEKWIVLRADQISRPRQIIIRIRQAILASDLVLADLTGSSPNVFYELGLAHALGSDVILLTQEKDVPFNLRTEQAIFYSDDKSGLEELVSQLLELVGKGTW